MNNKLKAIASRIIGMVLTLIIPSLCFGQEKAAPTESTAFSSSNMALYALTGVIILFVFIIFVLANGIKIANKTYLEKLKAEKNKILPMILGFVFLSSVSSAQDAKPAMSANTFNNLDIYLLSFIVFILFIVVLVLVRTMFLLMGIKNEAELSVNTSTEPSKVRTWFQKFNETVPIEEEDKLDMSHDYDGIRELDNKIPAWWTWAMTAFVLFSVVYLYRMFVSETLPNQYTELALANEIALVQKEEYLKKGANNVDENTVKMLGDADIVEGANLYAKNCLACHGDKGQGGVGPNLADDYWIHKGSIKDIFYSIKYGWQEKGMKSWKDDFAPIQMAQITSFVKTLRGTNPPAPKEKQGELYIEEAGTTTSSDSSKVTIAPSDSSKK